MHVILHNWPLWFVCLAMIVAAVIDVRTFTISNRLNAAVAAGAPLYWLSIALNPWPGMAIQLAAVRVHDPSRPSPPDLASLECMRWR